MQVLLPLQQPAQLAALQPVWLKQLPVVQTWPEPQAWQKFPLRPQLVRAVPATQVPLEMSMQPEQGAQVPLTQVEPAWQL